MKDLLQALQKLDEAKNKYVPLRLCYGHHINHIMSTDLPLLMRSQRNLK
jgi:hypothetical protein